MGNLSNLEKLDLSVNKLQELPRTFTNLQKLEELFINQNFIYIMPSGICELASLKVLHMESQ